MSVFGNRVLRKEDPKFLTVGGTYVADLKDPLLDGAAHVVYVRSTMAHARIGAVETSDAAAMPGVIGVFTAADIDLADLPPDPPLLNMQMPRPVLAKDKVRFVGELVAAIVAETQAQAVDAAEAVWPDYDPLPAVIDPVAAVDGGTLLFEDAGTNIAFDLSFGQTDDFFDGCEVVVTADLVNQRVAGCPL